VSAEQIRRRREILERSHNYLVSQVDKIQSLVEKIRSSFQHAGTVDWNTYQEAVQRLAEAKIDKLQASVSPNQLEADADIARCHINRALKLMVSEQDYVTRKIGRLSIKAPIDGRVRLFVGEHTPVKRGFVLAELSEQDFLPR
jgi:hypothetical protein